MITKFDVGDTIYIPATIEKIAVDKNKEPHYSMTAKYVHGIVEIDEKGILRNCLTSSDALEPKGEDRTNEMNLTWGQENIIRENLETYLSEDLTDRIMEDIEAALALAPTRGGDDDDQ